MADPLDLEIIVGTYEEFVIGYKVIASDKEGHYLLEQSFTNHGHSGSIRSLATIGKFLVSGSSDEAIRVINMSRRVEHGFMQQQIGTISCLTNHGSRYLFSGCQDGTICIWKSGNWLCEKTLDAHKNGVMSISVHPSGKLALSVGADKTLKTWNLVKGRTGYVTNLHGVAEVVKWSPGGNFYAVGISQKVLVYDVNTAEVVYTADFGSRVYCICYISEEVIAIGGDKKVVDLHDVAEKKRVCSFEAHNVRTKDMAFSDDLSCLITASNCDQSIKIWKVNENEPPTCVSEINTTCRITCLTLWSSNIMKKHAEISTSVVEDSEGSGHGIKKGKRKRSAVISPDESETVKTKTANPNTEAVADVVQNVKSPNADGNTSQTTTTSPSRKLKSKHKNKSIFTSSDVKRKRLNHSGKLRKRVQN